MSSSLSAAQCSLDAKKAAATRKGAAIKPFGNESTAERRAAAFKAAAQKAEGIKPFGNMTAAQRSLAAKKAIATRRARGEKI